jgi:serine/threonine protein kinase
MSDKSPQEIDGYEVVETLGAGASSIVYKVRDKGGSELALKLFFPGLGLQNETRNRLKKEAKALLKVSSSRVTKFLKVGEAGDSVYLLMELVKGKTLEETVQGGGLSGLLLQSAAEGVLEALEDIHRSGVIHRDLKPGNIMLGPEGIKIIDFGLSAVEDAGATSYSIVAGGTPAWLSPEQALGSDVSQETDIFSFGLILAFMFTAKNPFGVGRPDAMIYRIVNEEPDIQGVPSSLQPLLQACLSKEPGKRPSIDEIRAGLRAQVSGSGATSNQTVMASPTVLARFGRSAKPGARAAANPKSKSGARLSLSASLRKRMLLAVSVVLVGAVALVVFGFLFPSTGNFIVKYVNESAENHPKLAATLNVSVSDGLSSAIDLPKDPLPAEFAQSVGRWSKDSQIIIDYTPGSESFQSLETEVDLSTFSPTILQNSKDFIVEIRYTDDDVAVYAGFDGSEDFSIPGAAIVTAPRTNEKLSLSALRKERGLCFKEEGYRLNKLVGGAVSFLSSFAERENHVFDGVGSTIAHSLYAERHRELAEDMLADMVFSISPEVNGNARELSDDVIFAVRETYSSYSLLADAYSALARTVATDYRYDGSYGELYSREWEQIDRSYPLFTSASHHMAEEVREQALAACNAKFPELQQ